MKLGPEQLYSIIRECVGNGLSTTYIFVKPYLYVMGIEV